MKTYRILLKPKGIIKNIPSSETLFGAICWGIRTLYNEEELKVLLKDFDNCNRKFIPSCAFPLLKAQNGLLYCYPKPLFPDPNIKEMKGIAEKCKLQIVKETREKAKIEIEEKNQLQFSKRVVISKYRDFKKIEYLSETLFNRLINGEKIITLYCEYLEGRLNIIKSILLTTEESAKIGERDLMEEKVSARNKIDRLSFSTVPGGEIYYEKETYLNLDVFQLYFLLLTEDIDFFNPIFRWLEDTGIGGNRTIGRGHYDIKKESEVKLPKMNNNSLFISLSKYLLADAEIDWESRNNYYELLPYQPRFDTMFFKGGEFIKERITYFAEGSILQAKESKEYYGKLHPSAKFQDQIIYQCGLTIPVFIKMERR